MANERIGWKFGSTEERTPTPPPEWSVIAVGYLVGPQQPSQEFTERESCGVKHWKTSFGAIIENVGRRSWSIKSSATRSTDMSEVEAMAKDDQVQQHQKHEVSMLESIERVARHPVLGRDEFPDPEMRKKVVPLVRKWKKENTALEP